MTGQGKTAVISLARWLVAGGLVAGGVYVVAQWDDGAAWALVVLILLGVLIVHPSLLGDFTRTIEGILGTGAALGKAPTRA